MRTLILEPQRLILVILAIVLLIPLGMVFWLLVTHQPRPFAQRQAELEAELRERAREAGIGDKAAIGMVSSSSVELVAYPGTPNWVSFYPRRWVGIIGFIAIGLILLCLILSLFVRTGLEVSAEVLSGTRPVANAERGNAE